MTGKGFIQKIKESVISIFHKKKGHKTTHEPGPNKRIPEKDINPVTERHFRMRNTYWPLQEEWRKTKAGIYYYSLENYVPGKYSFYKYPFLKAFEKEIRQTRKWIWDFKYNLQDPSPVAHAHAVVQAVERISFIINNSFQGFTDCITFLCLPASNNLIYNLRFREFATLVCMKTGMIDAFDHVHVRGQFKPKHLGGDYAVSFIVESEWLQGRNVILFDDVTSSGRTIDVFGPAISMWNIRVLCALTLARTVSLEKMEQGVYTRPVLETKFKELEKLYFFNNHQDKSTPETFKYDRL